MGDSDHAKLILCRAENVRLNDRLARERAIRLVALGELRAQLETLLATVGQMMR